MGCAPGEEVPAGPETLPLRVEYAGCQTVLPGPTCILRENRKLRLWIRTPEEVRPELTIGGRGITDPGTEVREGVFFQLSIPEGVREITVRDRAESWTLALAEPEPPAWLRQFDELFKAEQLEAARRLLEEKAASPSRCEQAIAFRKLARLELQGEIGPDESERTREYLARAVAAYRDGGRAFDEVIVAGTLAWLLIQERQFSKARTVLDALPQVEDGPAEAAYFVAYYRGLLAGKIGDSRSALVHLTEAVEQAERVNMVHRRQEAEQVLGGNLQRLGRSQEAAQLFARLREARQDMLPCNRALLLNNHAWHLLLALEAGESVDDPAPLLEEALELWTTSAQGCIDSADQRLNALINLALAHHHGGRPDEARHFLARAHALNPRPEVHYVLWSLDIEARLDLDAGRPDRALELYLELEELAESTLSPEARWRATCGRARSLEALGRRPAALTALAEAEKLLDEECLQVPHHEGRDTFLAQREAATRLYLDLLLAGGRPADAFAVARRARSRVLRSLRRGDRLAHLPAPQQELWVRTISEYQALRKELDGAAAGAWRLPADRLSRARAQRAARHKELGHVLDRALRMLDLRGTGPEEPLPAPNAGEVVLAYHPLPRGWVAFAATRDGVTARRLEPLDDALPRPRELATRLLEPFAAEIRGARRVRVLPYGALRKVDFHALPFAGDVLLAARPVVYGLDLVPPPPRAGPRRALLVADPGGNLPAARIEVEAVRQALAAGPGEWEIQTLEGSRADGDAVRRALPRAVLFHYAGHADFSGRGGWESALPLAHATRLTVGDILTLEAVPEWVVLSGCETGRSGQESALESIGLAHAFLAAGARRVIAAVRPVADRTAAELIPALYRDGGRVVPDLAALQRAQLERRRLAPGADWSSFRVIEP